jgi:hypothetical protein
MGERANAIATAVESSILSVSRAAATSGKNGSCCPS